MEIQRLGSLKLRIKTSIILEKKIFLPQIINHKYLHSSSTYVCHGFMKRIFSEEKMSNNLNYFYLYEVKVL